MHVELLGIQLHTGQGRSRALRVLPARIHPPCGALYFLRMMEKRYSSISSPSVSRLSQNAFLMSRRVAGPLIGYGIANTIRAAAAARTRSKQSLMRSLAELIRCICLISPAPHMFCVGFVRCHFVIVCGLHYPPHSSTGVSTCSLCGAAWCRSMPV